MNKYRVFGAIDQLIDCGCKFCRGHPHTTDINQIFEAINEEQVMEQLEEDYPYHTQISVTIEEMHEDSLLWLLPREIAPTLFDLDDFSPSAPALHRPDEA